MSAEGKAEKWKRVNLTVAQSLLFRPLKKTRV